MHEYRQVIHRMRQGQSDRAISKAKLMGRLKCAWVRSIAQEKGWLGNGPLPDDQQLSKIFKTSKNPNPTQTSLTQPYEKKIETWVDQGIQATTIFQTLVEQFGFVGSYSSVRRKVKKIRGKNPEASCVLDFAPAEAAQVDFGKGPTIIDVFTGEVINTWIFVMTLCFSRHMYAEIITNQKVETWLNSHRHAFEFFNGVVGKLIIDDFGLKPLKSTQDEDFHDVVSERYERKSTIVTSNLDIPEWIDAFPNRILGEATIDRLRHGAYTVVLDGKSYRSPRPMPKPPKTSGQKTTKIGPMKGGEKY